MTILLVGTETKGRKHIDWGVYSSMVDGPLNKKSGMVVVNLPTVDNGNGWAPHGAVEKETVYPDQWNWQQWSRRAEFEEAFPYMPSRVVDSLVSGAKISVVGWARLNEARLRFLVDAAYAGRASCEYALSAPMRRNNS